MVTPPVRFHFVWPIVLISLGLIALAGVMAVFLLRQQAGIAEVMGENIESRRAAADLEESLIDLIGRLENQVEGVATLHQRVEKHLVRIDSFADHEEERVL